jgi:hypothetical protein
VAERTGWPLFHNHLTVSAITSVFTFGSTEYASVVHRLRLDVFETAARAGVDLVFTNNSAWPGFRDFAGRARDAVRTAGGDVLFVRVTAPIDVLTARVADDSRRAHGKLVDPDRLREMLAAHDDSTLHEDDLVLDTSTMEPAEAAGLVVSALGRTAGSSRR